MQLQHTIKSFLRPREQIGYLAECLEISVVTEGETVTEGEALDEVFKIYKKLALHLEGEGPAEFGLVNYPSVLVTFELQPAYA